MVYIIVFLAGAAAAASGLLIAYYGGLLLLRREQESLTKWRDRLASESSALAEQKKELADRMRHAAEAIAAKSVQQAEELENNRRKVEQSCAVQASDIEKGKRQLADAIAAFEEHKVQYDSLVRENSGLKQDLFNLSVQLKKTDRDQAALAQRQDEIGQKANELADRYLEENVSWISAKLSSSNFAGCKQRLLKVIEACRGIGFLVPDEKEQSLVDNLKKEYEQAVRDEFAREEQARIKAQIREEEKLAREREKQLQDAERARKDAEREEATIQAALEKALQTTRDEHSVEVEFYKAKLKEAEEKRREAEEANKRAISQAQLTKSGYVYVLSNIGSFGEGVFKIGMTRRLEPMDRVRELGDASVPFPFDVHMMISCNDAPTLENALHREFHRQRLNKVNFRKEFFRIDFESVHKIVESQHGEVEYVAEPAALQYRESTTMTDEDYEFVEHTVESVMGEEANSAADE